MGYQQQQQPQYQMQQPQTIVVVDNQHAQFVNGFGRTSTQCVCPHCRATVATNVVQAPGSSAWLFCIGLAFIGLWPCMCIPFCMDPCQDVTHSCPNCGIVIVRRPSGTF
jgi:lipopolysaccharide-induced tumor necrosis factor-alpha factor